MKKAIRFLFVFAIMMAMLIPATAYAGGESRNGLASTSVAETATKKYAATNNAEKTTVKLSKTQLELTVNQTYKLKATVKPKNITGRFYSNNNDIVRITKDGNITAKSKGSTYVYFKAKDGTIAKCKVKVKVTSLPLTLKNSSLDTIYDKSLGRGIKVKITYKKNKKSFYKVRYESLNKKIATVDSQGYVYPKKVGSTKIKVNADGKIKYFTINITSTSNTNLSLNKVANQYAIKMRACTRYVYGKSYQGRELEAYIIKNENSKSKKILFMDFACHGFEDSYSKDGKVLVNIGNDLVKYYSLHPEKLKDYTLVVVPCANPDGTIAGKNNLRACKTAFGRCTAGHVDMNRDFNDFKARESRALRDLFKLYPPKVYLNYHGWLSTSIGTPWLARLSTKTLKLSRVQAGSYGKGYIINYVKNKYKASVCLVEYKSPSSAKNSVGKTKSFISAIVNR